MVNGKVAMKIVALVCVFVALALFAVSYAAPASASTAVSVPDTVLTHAAGVIAQEAATQPQAPASLSVPAIGLTTMVVPVGLTATHAVDVPNTLKLSGWYTGGVTPGQVGSSLIVGHVGDNIGTPGVFANLHNVRVGDDLYVRDAAGKTEHFVVRETDVYALADVPMKRILEGTSERRLNIITCHGAWDTRLNTFSERFVVYAELVS